MTTRAAGAVGIQVLSAETTASATGHLDIAAGVTHSAFGAAIASAATTAAGQTVIGGGTVGVQIFEAATTASAREHLNITAVASVVHSTFGAAIASAATTAAGQLVLGGAAAGITVFEAATTAAVQTVIGGGSVGIDVFEAATTAAVRNITDAGGGAWTFISAVTAVNAATADFTSGIDSTFSQYVIVGTDINPATDGPRLWFRTDSNGGASFDAGASDYSWTVDGIRGTATVLDGGDVADSEIQLTGQAFGISSDAGDAAFIVLWINNPAGTTYNKIITWQLAAVEETANNMAIINGTGTRIATAAINAVQFLMASGNLDGVFRLYGVSNS